MTWLIVGGLLILAFAPALWLMPTKRDRQLVKLREQARREGLVVEVAELPKIAARADERVGADGVARIATRPCSAYVLFAPKPWQRAPCWFLLRAAGGAAPLGGWTEHPDVPLPTVETDYWRAVSRAVAELEDHCLAIEMTRSSAAWYWRENLGGREASELVGEIAARLRALATLQAGFEPSSDTDE